MSPSRSSSALPYGNSVTFPAWRSRLEDVLAIQGVLDIVQGKVPCPKEQPTDSNPIVRTKKGYNPEEFCVDWDTLCDIACSTIKLTLSVNLSIRYKDLKPASKLFNTICKAYEKNTRACRLFLKPIWDHLVYSPVEVSLDNAIGALESHEVLTQVSADHFNATASAGKPKTKLGCWDCGPKGHHLFKCSNPSIKNKPTTQSSGWISLIGDPWQWKFWS
ncbi:hypothetical protein H4Q26_017931 [Puccinia striiformis f. sp. tritici PST-130]|uniref:CCHC-type domain-containing protein n=1 Tax=Puccinia striiformis f. sp. tritici PST-78 TaxID=1165861 RepID=A0A0L0VA85_9BASI|nr:hypothetical protein H4Q26_017931 [Puccinia striiformis f. sp. tritici PST-130]KNE96197.1 hypothetical protein PSTG_10463 [Puccinia striiformis f. sp. tritici PST-78]